MPNPIPAADIPALAAEYDARAPEEILDLALGRTNRIAVSFSGAEDVVLIDMAKAIRSDLRVFSLDTGRLHADTYRFLDGIRRRYGLDLDVLSPDAAAVERLVRDKGLFSFFEDGHTECCNIRKVGPLRRHLATLDGWITGQRKDQSPTRAAVPVVQVDTSFSTAERTLIKWNPLANWSSAQVWSYIRERGVPFNPLHERGFVSIGCEPCTRPVLPGQHEREGRWWWEDATKKECGLHAGNVRRS